MDAQPLKIMNMNKIDILLIKFGIFVLIYTMYQEMSREIEYLKIIIDNY